MTRRALCSLGLGPHAELLELTMPTLERYALRHDYDLVARTTAPDSGRPHAWSKVPLIRELLDTYDTVVWLDADAVVVDQGCDIAVGAPRRAMSLVTHVIDGVPLPNTGVMVWRRGPDAVALLEAIWRQVDCIHHRWWENSALLAVLGGDPDRGLVTRGSRWRAARTLGRLAPRWNSVPVVAEAAHPAIVHLAGWTHDDRVRRIRALVAGTLDAV